MIIGIIFEYNYDYTSTWIPIIIIWRGKHLISLMEMESWAHNSAVLFGCRWEFHAAIEWETKHTTGYVYQFE